MSAEVYAGWLERYASEPKGMRAGWMALLGDPVMPRDCTFIFPSGRFKKTVKTTQEYLRVLEEHAPKGDSWAAWSPASQYDCGQMDRIFADIDSPDLEQALQTARRFEEWCMWNFEVQPPAVFTAGKGFHMHFTFDPVDATGTVFSDAFLSLVQGSGAVLDAQPLKHRKAAPRVPYSMNLKATGKAQEPRFVVPVDLTWSLKEIQRASAQINVLPFEVPHSPVLAGLLEPAVQAAKKAMERSQAMPEDRRKGIHDDLVTAAIAFSEDVGWRLVNSLDKPDGRRRVLTSLYIPALMRQSGGDADSVIKACEAWVDMAGGSWKDYKRFVLAGIKECRLKDGTFRSPIGLKRFWMENAELRVRPGKPRIK